MAELQPHQLELLTTQGFVRRYFRHYTSAPGLTQREAYQLTEIEHHAITGRHRYASFESFKPTMYRHLKSE